MLAYITSLLPLGALPKWLLFISIVSVFNTAQNFIAPLKLTRRVYSVQPKEGGFSIDFTMKLLSHRPTIQLTQSPPSPSVTALTSRMFGAWTLTSAVIRGYAAYYLHVKPVYELVQLSYAIALLHYSSELLVYRTVRLNGPAISPFIVAISSTIWLWTSYSTYIN
jgi:hypothetical protein